MSIIGTLPNDDEISFDLVTVSQAMLDMRELQDLGLVVFLWELDLEALRFIVCRGAQLGMIPTRRDVEACVPGVVKEMGCTDNTANDTKQLVELIDEVRELQR